MFRKLRYVLVLAAGALVIGLTLLVTAGRTPNRNTDEEKRELADFSLRALSGISGGNAMAGSEGDEAAGFSALVPAVETLENLPETALESPSAPLLSHTGSPLLSSSPVVTTAVPEESPSEEEEEKSGLRAYFDHKLIIDDEKVDLYLNVRGEPDPEGTILSVIYPNDIVPYADFRDGWFEVEMDGYNGYVSAEYVLTDDAAYEARRDTVAYAVMTKEDEIRFYAEPDADTETILAAAKGEVFRVVSQEGAFYEVSVVSPIYETLFVEKRNVVLYYLFLGPGNDNELSDENERYLGELNITDNLVKAEKIKIEAKEEQASYEAYLASIEAERLAAEEAYRRSVAEAEEAYRQSVAASEAEAARQAEAWRQAEAARQAAAQQAAAQQSANTGNTGNNLRSVGVFRVTFYCHCQKCCGVWGSNDPNYAAHGASGMALQSDYTVAVNPAQIPYGTRLMINGREYIAADCGVGTNCVDIYRRTHAEALAGQMFYAEVFIIE
ncbi:MAG: SH3 domain-containing protein [Lachnospiraceae bacterium]|nr:SH3 domain-containing protein [Lachnospiraceae bacterium]